jgi:hypothetical protein
VHIERIIDSSIHDLTVFKLRFGHLTLKIYDKGEHLLLPIWHHGQLIKCRDRIKKYDPVVTPARSQDKRRRSFFFRQGGSIFIGDRKKHQMISVGHSIPFATHRDYRKRLKRRGCCSQSDLPFVRMHKAPK